MLTPTLRLPSITQEISLNTIRFNRSLGIMETRLTQFGRRVSNLGISLSLAVSIPLQLAVVSIVRNFGAIEAAALDASSLMKGVGAEMGAVFAKLAMNMSLEFPFAPDEILKGVAEIERAGFSAQQAWGLIPNIMKTAIAGNADIVKTSEQVSGVMTTYGLKVADTSQLIKNQAEVLDVLQMAANETNANFDQMVEGMISFGPRARALNMNIYESAAVIGQFHQNLIKASKSGTYFDMSMRDIIRMFNKNKEVWMGPPFNLDIFDSGGQLRNFSDIILDLEHSIAGLNDESKFQALAMLGLPDRSLKATLALIGQANAAKELERKLRSAGGTIQDIYDVKIQGLNRSLGIMGNQFTRAGQHLAQAFIPMLTTASQWISILLFKFSSLAPAVQRSIALWTLFGIAIGPVLIILGMMISSIQLLITPVVMLITFVGRLAMGLGILAVRGLYTAVVFSAQLFVALANVGLATFRLTIWTIQMIRIYGVLYTMTMLVRGAFLALAGAQALLNVTRLIAQFQQLSATFGVLRAMVMMAAAAYRALGISAFLARMLSMGLAGVLMLGAIALTGYALHSAGVFDWMGRKIKAVWDSIAGTAGSAMEGMEATMAGMTAEMEKMMGKLMDGMKDKMKGMGAEVNKQMEAQKLLQAQIFQDFGGIDTMEEKIQMLDANLQAGVIDYMDYWGQKKMLMEQQASEAAMNVAGTGDFDAPSDDDKMASHSYTPFKATEYGTEEEYKARIGGQQSAMLKVNQRQLAEVQRGNTIQRESRGLLASIRTAIENNDGVELVAANV